MIIRQETEQDFSAIYDFVKTAFLTAYVSDGPDGTEQDLVNKLRSSGNYIPELALVMEDESADNKLIGHIMLTKIAIQGVHHLPKNMFEILILAPVAIDAGYRNKGHGSGLVRESLKRAKAEGYAAVILLGDPKFYERFGFVSAEKFGIKNKQKYPDENVLVLELVPGILEGIEGTVDFDY
ncbi:MAG: N-acetyltransferase [Methanosarcinales archaeon]|nr:N-acetyltransferase [Methanosarcinales archaeon]